MIQYHESFGNEDSLADCVYCGRGTESRDHVPPKFLLDEPHPVYLPVVPSCRDCNGGASLDEQYLGCVVECAVVGSTDPDVVARVKVARTLRRRPSLAARIEAARVSDGHHAVLGVEIERVSAAVVKLARGHAAYELAAPQRLAPTTVRIAPLITFNALERTEFEAPPSNRLWPEIGSRGLQRSACEPDSGWVEVQRGRYRFIAVPLERAVLVRIVVGEYLGCEVAWVDEAPDAE